MVPWEANADAKIASMMIGNPNVKTRVSAWRR